MPFHKIIKHLILLILTTSCVYQKVISKKTEGLAIIQGLTGPYATRIAVLVDKNTAYSYYITSVSQDKKEYSEIPLNEKTSHTRKFSAYKIDEIYITSLEPQKEYRFIVRNSQNHLVDWREFQSLNTEEKNPTIAIASCMSDAPTYQKVGDQIWGELYTSQPHVIFLIGDTVYVDYDKDGNKFKNKISPPERLWNRYVETRSALKLFRMRKLIPILAVWDDHDYGVNNGGKDYPYKKQAKDVFQQFFPRAPFVQSGLEKGPGGIAFYWKAFSQGFIFADNRTFRSEGKEKAGTHWGKKQEDWILQMFQNKPSLNSYWLINGGQFWGAYHRWESYEGHHPDSFKSFIGKLGKNSQKPVWFISGDRHLAELQMIKEALPYTTYELTTSSIQAGVSRSFSWKEYPNPRKIEGVEGYHNYAVVKSAPHSKEQMNFDVTVYGLNKKILFSRKLSLSTPKK